jgi:hypothetical protein
VRSASFQEVPNMAVEEIEEAGICGMPTAQPSNSMFFDAQMRSRD